MKKIFFVVFSIIIFSCRVEAQQKTEIEIDGIIYDLKSIDESPYWQLSAIGIAEEMESVVIPSNVVYLGNVLAVEGIDMDGNQNSNLVSVRNISIPNTVTSISFHNLPLIIELNIPNSVIEMWLYNMPNLQDFNIPDSVRTMYLNRLALSSLTIPPTITNINFDLCGALHKLIVSDGTGPIHYDHYDKEEVPSITSPLDTIYYGRNIESMFTEIHSPAFPELKSLVLGKKLSKLDLPLDGINLDELIIPSNIMLYQTELGSAGFSNCPTPHYGRIIIEDSYHGLLDDAPFLENTPLFYDCYCDSIYVGRDVYLGDLSCRQIIFGPTVNNLGQAYGNAEKSTLNITGDSAFVKIYRKSPPINIDFSTSSYLESSLFVLNESVSEYRMSDIFGRFFRIYGFEWGQRRHLISVFNPIITSYDVRVIGGVGTAKLFQEDGVLFPGMYYQEGDTAVITAPIIADGNSYFWFMYWEENDEIVSTSNEFTFVVNEDRALTVCYKALGYDNQGVLSFVVPKGSGKIKGGNHHYVPGSLVELTATPNDGYYFEKWTVNGVEVCTTQIYSFIMNDTGQIVIAANFKRGNGINDDQSDGIYAYVRQKMLVIEGVDRSSEIAVYNVQGQCVYRGLGRNISVPCAGLYIVTVENRRIKVVVE